MDTGIIVARWVVGKALNPVLDGLVEAWAASQKLGPNVDALKMELLYARAMLNNVRGREIHNTDLNELLQKLRDLAYNADDVLDELDYFRIQDELNDTSEAAAEHAKGCVSDLFLNAHHTAKAAGKLLGFSSSCSSCATNNGPGDSITAACCGSPHNTIHAIGKRLCFSTSLVDDCDHDYGCVHDERDHVKGKSTPKLKFDRVGLSKKMKIIVEQLQPVCAKVTAILNLELMGSHLSIESSTAKSRPITTPTSIEPTLYGRDAVMKRIIDSITQGTCCEEYLTVLPIIGPGGIGKTTLIQHIYNSQQVQNHFQIMVWTCVSQSFNVDKLIEEIKEKLPSVEGEKKGSAEELIVQRLKSKRFLFILDDIWKCESDDWKRLLVPLRKGQTKGNIIIVTTRFLVVTETVKTSDNKIQLEGIDDEAFWELFLAYVFGPEKSKNDKDLLCIGKDIVKKLKGSPLAAKTVGKLLSNHLDRVHWMRVLDSKEWELQAGDHDIMPALKLSYDYLPFHLQQCFSYCALFPEDYKFNNKELIRFWIGLDILHSESQNKAFEDIALSNIDSLVSHGFFKREETDGHPCYIIHDLLHNLALKVASLECVSLHSSNVKSVEIRPSIRHLSIITDGANDTDGITDENFKSELIKLKKRLKVENVQTLMIFGEVDKSFIGCFHDLFKEASALRVLYLPKMPFAVGSILDEFTTLVHLRYLRLGTTIGNNFHLPINLSKFYHLRILDLEKWDNCFQLPGDISNLAKLHNFLVPGYPIHPNISNVGKLQFLQELKGFQVNRKDVGFELKQLGYLMELRELRIDNLEKVHTKEEAAEAKLLSKTRLRKLELNWKQGRTSTNAFNEDQILEKLQPHSSLQELSIHGHGGSSCPKWLGTELSVKFLETFRLKNVVWNILPPLGEVFLVGGPGEESIGQKTSQNFRSLKRLELVKLPNLRKWVAKEIFPTFFSVLEVLIVRKCNELAELPFSYHTYCTSEEDVKATCFPRLRELEIHNCPKIVSLPPIPYTQTLCSVNITDVGTGLESLVYSSKSSKLEIKGNKDLKVLDDNVLASRNLHKLHNLTIEGFPPLEERHLQMLTSLERFSLFSSSIAFNPTVERSDVEWRLSIENLMIQDWNGSGKELTQLLFHLPKLSLLSLGGCRKKTLLSVALTQQQTSAQVESTQVTASNHRQQQKAEDLDLLEEEEVTQLDVDGEDEDDDRLLLTNSLEQLWIVNYKELILVSHPLPIGHHNKEEEGTGGGWGLQALCSLRQLGITGCPLLLSAYEAPACLFPSSLQYLQITGPMEGVQMLDLSNLTSLTKLFIEDCGEYLRKGLLPLLAQGQLSNLIVYKTYGLFAGVLDSILRGAQEEQEQLHLLEHSSKLRVLETDDLAGILVKPICRLLSSSLTNLTLQGNSEVERFTNEQEEALQLLTFLQDLKFIHYDKLRCLPAGLHRLTNLKRLMIMNCPSIQSLPKDGLPGSLKYFIVRNNEKLVKQCKKLKKTNPEIELIL
uniref:NBS-LRR-like resistance protein n=1 Tax=Oryza sativa TaxID=4530 RepID=A0A0U2QI38_ORYSA|nr:NBS-LRR-like resistance protein [Oryza sativa]